MVSVILLAQPDFGTYLVIMTASFVTFFVGGARKRHIQILVACGLVGFVMYALSIKAFFLTFVGLMMLAGLFIFIYEEVS